MAFLAPPATCARFSLLGPAQVRWRRVSLPFTSVTGTNGSTLGGGGEVDVDVDDINANVDWVEATSSFFEGDSRPIMLYDGVCNLCNGGVKFVRDNDSKRRIRFEALQSKAGRKLLKRSGRAPDDISSVVFVKKNRSYTKSEAVLKIMEYLNLPFPQLALLLQLVPWLVRDFVYDNIANNRYEIFGRSDSCEI